jgi:hypothetical protein
MKALSNMTDTLFGMVSVKRSENAAIARHNGNMTKMAASIIEVVPALKFSPAGGQLLSAGEKGFP